MSKSHRGKGIRELANRGRGTCGRCNIKNIKILYEVEIDGKKVDVCKKCNAAINNAKKNAVEAPVEEGKKEEPT
ncbi:MAG TPA: hypothetical protein VFC68_04775 [Treponemataceae bacterium]|nr:hypothetical protein [Treponemataceae bacterium]